MTTYYVGSGGNDGNSGLTWALRKLTLNGAEDVPVVANDTIYVGPGAYRETLTLDVSGGVGTPITYIGDITGENTDSVGGIVRVTGSDNDQTAVRASCITQAAARDYRTFCGFHFDTCSSHAVNSNGQASSVWIIEDCTFSSLAKDSVAIRAHLTPASAAWIVQRCHFTLALTTSVAIYISNGATVSGGHLIENCTVIGGYYGLQSARVGGIAVHNCHFIACRNGGIAVTTALAGSTITVDNSLFTYGLTGVTAPALGQIIEDYNNFYSNNVDRNNVAVGANSVAYSPLLVAPLLYNGLQLPWDFGQLSEWSQLARITDSGTGPSDDLHGITRPVTNSKRSWGAYQFKPAERDTVTTFGGSAASLALPDAGVQQIYVPTTNVATTFTVQVYREANYAGVNPQMIIKQPGQADDVTVDIGAAGAWNELTTTLTPAADPDWVKVELRSNNTAVAGNYATYFDELTPS